MAQQTRINRAWQLLANAISLALSGVSLATLAGCPTQPAPAPRPATPQATEAKTDESAIQPRQLLGNWSGQAWQVAPGGLWEDAAAAAFAVALAESPGESVRSVEPVSTERLAEFPSVTVELTVLEEHLAIEGIEGALVRIAYQEPGGGRARSITQSRALQTRTGRRADPGLRDRSTPGDLC